MDNKREIHVIIVAGGSGRRFGGDLPKQYSKLDDIPVLCHTVSRFKEFVPNAHIYTVVSGDMVGYWTELASMYGVDPGIVVTGGSTRWESVKNALNMVSDTNRESIVLVHDGARPLVDKVTVERVIEACRQSYSAVPVVAVTDSLRYVNPDGSSDAVDRSQFRSVVTPQGFILDDLKKAYELPYDTLFTDDASVMAAAGFTDTVLVESFSTNIKITHPGDLALASWYLRSRSTIYE